MAINEKQLGQARPGSTNPESLYSMADPVRKWIGKKLVIANTSGATATFRVFHDDDGSTYNQTTALFYDHVIAAGTTISDTGFMAGDNTSGNFAVRSSVADALTFTLYGAEIT